MHFECSVTHEFSMANGERSPPLAVNSIDVAGPLSLFLLPLAGAIVTDAYGALWPLKGTASLRASLGPLTGRRVGSGTATREWGRVVELIV
jgi:hypothetical protein